MSTPAKIYVITDYSLEEDLTVENGGLRLVLNGRHNVMDMNDYYDDFHKIVNVFGDRRSYYVSMNNSYYKGSAQFCKIYSDDRFVTWIMNDGILSNNFYVIYYRSKVPLVKVEELRRVMTATINIEGLGQLIVDILTNKTYRYGLDLSARYSHLTDYSDKIQKQLLNTLRAMGSNTCVMLGKLHLIHIKKREGDRLIHYLRLDEDSDSYDNINDYKRICQFDHVWMEGDDVIDIDTAQYLTEMTLSGQIGTTVRYANRVYRSSKLDKNDELYLITDDCEKVVIRKTTIDAEIRRLIRQKFITGKTSEEMVMFDRCYSISSIRDISNSLTSDLKEKYQLMIAQHDHLVKEFQLLWSDSIGNILSYHEKYIDGPGGVTDRSSHKTVRITGL